MSLTLFEKLIPALAADQAGAATGRQARWVLAESVRRHLIRLLNTHENSALACPEYGLPDLRSLSELVRNDRSGVEMLVKQRIEKFEPRLIEVEVHYIDSREWAQAKADGAKSEDLFRARFRVRGQLVERAPGGQQLIQRGICSLEVEQDAKGQLTIDQQQGRLNR